ncbi:periplasmic heavy metal sensor [Yoonia sp. R2331]|uniref:periplasmic heavy metal sensor n=1 Tax=Yoonia sp. R2331 TaxID=3237238 RepID=UPI0034E3A662
MADPARPRRRPIWRIVLVLSLALNLAVVGMFAGFAWRGGKQGPPRGVELSLGPVGQALSQQDRRAILQSLRQNRDLRPGRDGAGMAGIEEMIAALRADPFDPAAFSETLNIPQARQQKLKDAARAALTERVTEMSAQERAAFAERIADATRRRR